MVYDCFNLDFDIFIISLRWGLRLRAVGQFPMAAQTAGINVISMKYQAILISGLVGAWPELICHWDIVLCLQKI